MSDGEKYYLEYMNGAGYDEIAAKHKTTHGVVAGAIYRHRKANKLPPRTPIKVKPSENDNPGISKRAKKAAPLAIVERPPPVPVSSFADVLEKNTCKFIEGDSRAGTDSYCGHARLAGSPYCPEHHKRCYMKPRAHVLYTEGAGG